MPLNREENHTTMLIRDGLNGPLTERGIAEATLLGKYLSQEKFIRAYASEFIRTQETVDNILKQNVNPTPEILIEKRISERNAGTWVEKTPMDMIKEAMKVGVYPHCLPCPEGETFEEVKARAGSFFSEVCAFSDKTQVSENVLVGTHGAWLASFMEHLLTNPDLYQLENCDQALARKPAPTTGLTKIVIEKSVGDNQPRLLRFLTLYDQTHLKDQMLPK
jgi:broad specificity phosphatase PhoE